MSLFNHLIVRFQYNAWSTFTHSYKLVKKSTEDKTEGLASTKNKTLKRHKTHAAYIYIYILHTGVITKNRNNVEKSINLD